jgi:hypothetical protein
LKTPTFFFFWDFRVGNKITATTIYFNPCLLWS